MSTPLPTQEAILSQLSGVSAEMQQITEMSDDQFRALYFAERQAAVTQQDRLNLMIARRYRYLARRSL